MTIRVALLFLALICFMLDALWRGQNAPVVKLTPLGLALATASFLVH